MQKLIAKYGSAAHLAILAVAPLLLIPFWGDAVQATVLLWLSVPAICWMMLEPSVRGGESPHEARARVAQLVAQDPLFWFTIVLVVYTGIRALNTGIGLAYDAEVAKWKVSAAHMSLYPGVVGTSGYVSFAAAVSLTVIFQGIRHALGKSARTSFLLVSSALAGLAAVIAISAIQFGNERALAAARCLSAGYSFVGLAFGLFFLSGIVALIAAYERRWEFAMLLMPLSIGGTGAGMFVFSTPFLIYVVVAAAVILLIYAFAYACRTLKGSGEFKFLVVLGISLTLGSLLVAALLPEEILKSRLEPLLALKPFSDKFIETRTTLSGIAVKTWLSNLWIGSGIGSFPLSFRFSATGADWQLMRGTVDAVPNGWWLVLAERGIVGLFFLLLPAGFLIFTYVRRAYDGFQIGGFPHPACCLGVLIPVLLAVIGFFDCSLWRSDVLIVAGALTAVSANSFSRLKRSING